VQFEDAPTPAVRVALEARGARVLQDVPDNALLIAANASLSLDGLDVRYAAALDPRSKVSPLMEEEGANLQYIVEFHPDVDLNAARGIVLAAGLELRDNPDLGPQRLMVRWRPRFRASDPVWTLAAMDEVAYIFPASPDLIAGVPVIRCMGAVTETGGLPQYIATVGNGWDGAGLNPATLGYVFGAATTKLPGSQAQSEIMRAMQTWSQVVKITWTQATSTTSARAVSILFGKRQHGDGYPFDGPGNVLAHTFYPAPPNPEPLAGDMHLDDDEAWRIGANVDLFSVALHELGHALGLGHSDDPKAVMYPYYRMASSLGMDDVKAIQGLYAAGPAPAPPAAPAAPTTPSTPTTPATPATPTVPGVPVPPADRTAPTLSTTSPTASVVTTTASSIAVQGQAFDAVGLAAVTWSTNFNMSGTATGTRNWSATVPLLLGSNTITVKAKDLAGNTAWRSVVVVRR
jgi:hypothetical protein